MLAITPVLFLYLTLSLGGRILNSTLQRNYLMQVASPGPTAGRWPPWDMTPDSGSIPDISELTLGLSKCSEARVRAELQAEGQTWGLFSHISCPRSEGEGVCVYASQAKLWGPGGESQELPVWDGLLLWGILHEGLHCLCSLLIPTPRASVQSISRFPPWNNNPILPRRRCCSPHPLPQPQTL